jgi:hypothetical protein
VLIAETTISIRTYTLDLYTDPRYGYLDVFYPDFEKTSIPIRKRREIGDIYDQMGKLGPKAGLTQMLEIVELEEELWTRRWLEEEMDEPADEGAEEAHPDGEHSED